jgi:hypothetical protein
MCLYCDIKQKEKEKLLEDIKYYGFNKTDMYLVGRILYIHKVQDLSRDMLIYVQILEDLYNEIFLPPSRREYIYG